MPRWLNYTSTALLALIAIVVAVWWLNSGKFYQSAQYNCAAPREFVLGSKRPSYAEIYVGGWVSNGSLTIDGMPTDARESHPLKFEAGTTPQSIAASYTGDWYSPVRIKLTPIGSPSCFVKIVYSIG